MSKAVASICIFLFSNAILAEGTCPNFTGTWRYDLPQYDHVGIRTFKNQKNCTEFEMIETIINGSSEPFTHTKKIVADGEYRSWFAGQKVKFEFHNGSLFEIQLHENSQYFNVIKVEVDWAYFGDELNLYKRTYYKNGTKAQYVESWKRQK